MCVRVSESVSVCMKRGRKIGHGDKINCPSNAMAIHDDYRDSIRLINSAPDRVDPVPPCVKSWARLRYHTLILHRRNTPEQLIFLPRGV